VDASRRWCAEQFDVYRNIPSYRGMMDRGGNAGPEDVAITGSESDVRDQLEELASAGATDLVAAVYGPPDARARTLAALGAWNDARTASAA
jgi:hypothetical protein